MKTLDEIIKNTPIYWDDLYPKLNEWAKTIAIEYANSPSPQPSATAEEEKEFIGCTCKDEDKHGWTIIKCCNECGKPIEPFWVDQ